LIDLLERVIKIVVEAGEDEHNLAICIVVVPPLDGFMVLVPVIPTLSVIPARSLRCIFAEVADSLLHRIWAYPI
jgi:hypothetical protein